MQAHERRPTYLAVWGWLLALAIGSIALSQMPIPRTTVVTVIFLLAAVKAFLVAMHYMHLRYERVLIYAIALVPVAFVFILILGLVPDMVLGR